MLVLEAIRRFALERPDWPALIVDSREIGYREFDRRISAAGRAILARDPAPGGVAVQLVFDAVAAWAIDLALRSLGYDTVSVREAADAEALAGLDIRLLVTVSDEFNPPWPAIPGAAQLVLAPNELAPDEEGPLPEGPGGNHILLTSGTTGRWKMVTFDARGEALMGAGARTAVDAFHARDTRPGRALIFHFGLWTSVGYTWPIGLWQTGVTVVVAQGLEARDALDIPGVSHAVITPSGLEWIVAAPEGAFQRHDDMNLWVVAGALSESLFERVKARLTNNILVTLGATEAGGWASTQVKTPEDLRWQTLIPAGGLEIVDADGKAVGPGVVGQVRVPQSTRVTGYLNNPDATAAFFRDGFFYPGDLAVTDGKGRVRILGRVTDVLNIAGHKYPAGPLEEMFQQALGCNCACFSAHGATNADELHVVLETATPIEEARLIELARQHGTGFAAARFHFVPELPRTSTGKVERYRLREMLAAPKPA